LVHHWISRQLPDRPHPPVKRPINWFAWITSITILMGSATVLYVAWPYVLPVIQNRNIWAAISLISILLFTSGHMFNHIRKVPYVAGDGRGGISYFASGFQNQFGMETQLVAAMCKSFTLVISCVCFLKSSNTYRRHSFVCCHLPGRQGPENS
jgi:oligosaccharyltransferase complex subunit gamma